MQIIGVNMARVKTILVRNGLTAACASIANMLELDYHDTESTSGGRIAVFAMNASGNSDFLQE